jgi:hypothetical protein
VVLDANVFKGYFQVDIGRPHCLCGCPKALMAGFTSSNPVHHDDGGVIEHEWRNVVDRDWFDAWLAASLLDGIITYATPTRDVALEKKLQGEGFPSGRDIVYVRLSLAVANARGHCEFFTEDLDFYDPKSKGCQAGRRRKMLQNSSGPVAKLLAKSSINVCCVP